MSPKDIQQPKNLDPVYIVSIISLVYAGIALVQALFAPETLLGNFHKYPNVLVSTMTGYFLFNLYAVLVARPLTLWVCHDIYFHNDRGSDKFGAVIVAARSLKGAEKEIDRLLTDDSNTLSYDGGRVFIEPMEEDFLFIKLK